LPGKPARRREKPGRGYPPNRKNEAPTKPIADFGQVVAPWRHILQRHPEMAEQLEKFRETLQEPDVVLRDLLEEVVYGGSKNLDRL
jgi:hypothetical protein